MPCLHLWNSRGKFASHKIELLDSEAKPFSHLISITESIFKVDALKLGIMRIDLAVDIPKLPDFVFSSKCSNPFLRGGRINTGGKVEPGPAQNGDGENGNTQLWKATNLIRIYDKTAERLNEYRKS